MSNEIQVRSSLRVKNGNRDYRSNPTSFQRNQVASSPAGETPGEVTITTSGTDISLSHLTEAGACWFHNVDTVNFVTLGIYDPDTLVFYPFLEVGPGECYPVILSRRIGYQYPGAGTATSGGGSSPRLRGKADTASCKVVVHAFDR
jgi:hypothetical protein